MKKVTILSTSLRANSNSEMLALRFSEGAKDAHNDVKFITLKNKKISFCQGCLACQKLKHCVIDDDMKEIINEVISSDVLVFATPIYYYEMSGQMKTLIDRLNPIYTQDYQFKDIYLLVTAADTSKDAYKRALKGLEGFSECFLNTNIKKVIFQGGVTDAKEIANKKSLDEAYELGKNI